MIIVRIMGGLGNQMFQYAYAKSLEQKGYNVKIDTQSFYSSQLLRTYTLNSYNIDLPYASSEEIKNIYNPNLITKVIQKILNSLNMEHCFFTGYIEEEMPPKIDQKLLKPQDNSYIVGYFQSEEYFKNIKQTILDTYIIKYAISEYAKSVLREIKSAIYTCSIHIRRGDYLNKETMAVHGLCSIEYYQKSMKYINDRYPNSKYIVFSDDIAWCKDNLKVKNAFYVSNDDTKLPNEDIFLMSQCKHNIIANSSFSWWGAYLNQNIDKTVIAPKKWFVDAEQNNDHCLICEDWLKI